MPVDFPSPIDYAVDISKTAATLLNGGVILYPTDTIWGLGCLVNQTTAIQKIYQIKQRYEKKNLIVLVNSEDMLRRYVKEVPDAALELINSYQKPLTIVYPHAQNLPQQLVAADNTIAIRIVRNLFCTEVIRLTNTGLVSTSANITGQPAPASFSSIIREIRDSVDYIAMTDRDKLNKPAASTLIRLLPGGNFETLRD